MYVYGNPKTKKALKELVASGDAVVFDPGIQSGKTDGEVSVEGPHYPKAHTFYARVLIKDRVIVKVLS